VKRPPLLILALGAAVVVAVLLLRRPGGVPEKVVRSASPSPSASFEGPRATEAHRTDASRPKASRPRTAFDRLLEALRAGDRAKAKEALEDLRLAFAPEPVPDAENAAILYRKAFDLYPDGPTDEEAELLGKLGEGMALTPAERAVLEKVLEKHREAIALLHKAAAFPRCDFGVDYTKGFDAEMPHVAGLIRTAKLLQIEALLSTGSAAAEAARASMRLAEAVAEEPILLSQLVRGLCGDMARDSWQQAFGGDLPPDTLRGLLESLSPERYREGYEKSLIFELYAGAKLVVEGDFSAFGPEVAKARRPGDPLSVEDFAYYAHTMSEYSSLAGRPYYEIRDRLAALKAERVDGAPGYAEITRLLLPSFDRAAQRQAQAEAGVGTGRIAAALRLYRDAHGTYPQSTEALRMILPDLPVDPFTGRPFLYRREGDGFVVWSVGTDGLDSGGVSSQDDVLFRSPR
jgi:tetratricopeptide (TPR) repeat protein